MAVNCSFCGKPVDPNSRFTWHRVIGWERKGRAGGSDIMLREPAPDRQHAGGIAHDECVRTAKKGVSPEQGSLV